MIQKKILQLLIKLSLIFLLLPACNTAKGTSKGSKIMSEGVVMVGQGGTKVVEGIVTIAQGTVPIVDGIYQDTKVLGKAALKNITAP
mgnify:FL=1